MFEIELKSKKLKEYVYLVLNKSKDEPLYDIELDKITSLHLDKLDLTGESTDITIYDLVFFKKIKECTITNMTISDQELSVLNKLSSLKTLQLNNCSFSGKAKLELNLKKLIINKCKNVDMSLYEDMKTLKRLQIVNCNDINLKGISNLSNLLELLLQNISMDNIDEIQSLKLLKYLNLNGSKIKNLDKINEIPDLHIEHEWKNAIYDEESSLENEKKDQNRNYKSDTQSVKRAEYQSNEANKGSKSNISLGDLLVDIDSMSEEDIRSICNNIKSKNLNVAMDAETIKLLSENRENENIKSLLKGIKMPMSIDVSSIAEFRKSDVDAIKALCEETGCKIDKVYVNAGWDKAAEEGYSFEKYDKIVENAEGMLSKALKKLPDDASTQDKVMAIYNEVLKTNKYDYAALDANSSRKFSSRNLEGFFLNNGLCVCAGTAIAFKNLCECTGINIDYVQGMAGTNRSNPEYHAWVRAQLDDGKWYNCDPTWDANNVGEKYEYCLKSNEDFPGHIEDRSYNPTYRKVAHSRSSIPNRAATSISSQYLREKYQQNTVVRGSRPISGKTLDGDYTR